MRQQNSQVIDSEQFTQAFGAIAPLILEEWSQVSAEQLAATNGDLNCVVDCIATATEHTRAFVRRQLQELYQLAISKQFKLNHSYFTKRLTQLANEQFTESNLKDTISHLEVETEKLLQQLKEDVFPELNEKVQKHPVKSLLTAVGVGFVLGLLLGGRRGR